MTIGPESFIHGATLGYHGIGAGGELLQKIQTKILGQFTFFWFLIGLQNILPFRSIQTKNITVTVLYMLH
jgi:hypothetical protein